MDGPHAGRADSPSVKFYGVGKFYVSGGRSEWWAVGMSNGGRNEWWAVGMKSGKRSQDLAAGIMLKLKS